MTDPVQTSGLRITAEQLDGLYRQLGVQPHAVLALPSLEVAQAFLASPGGRTRFIQQLQRRQQRIALEREDPLNWTFEAETWADADRVLRDPETYLLGIFGGNRAQKTWYAIKRAMEAAILFPHAKIAICSESLEASIATVQALAWHYIKRHYEHLNRKQHSVFAVSYTQKNGFADGKLIFPNGSEVYFLTYNQEAGDYEGWEFGAPQDSYREISAKLRTALADTTGASDKEFLPVNLAAWRAQGRTDIPNVGAVCDESMPMSWLRMFSRRVKFRGGKLLWPFTPVKGITPSIKEMVGSNAVTLEHRPSELLPGQNLPDLPPGRMPYIRKCAMPGAKAIYFVTIYNPIQNTIYKFLLFFIIWYY